MAIRKIVRIDEEKCNGCGECVPNCAEGALQIIDGKARMISESYCDGLGACLGHCPMDAITIEEREADEFDEQAVNTMLAASGRPTLAHAAAPQAAAAAPVRAHAGGGCPSGGQGFGHHGAPGAHGQHRPAGGMPAGGCPGSRMMNLGTPAAAAKGGNQADEAPAATGQASQLGNWPLQLALLPVEAPFYQDVELVLAADCAAFALPDFHSRILKGRALAIGCPKLDDIQPYIEKLAEIIRRNRVKGLVLVHMEVPCCTGIVHLAREAARLSGKTLPARDITVGIRGQIQSDELEIYGPQS